MFYRSTTPARSRGAETRKVAVPFLLFVLAVSAEAAPKLRLTAAAVGPVSVNQGANAAAQTVEAFNAGDGNLSLQTSASATWLSASVGGSRPCSQREGACLPVAITFNTAALARGSYTAFLTVSDANALDAPQTISVTVQVGGGVPDSVDLFVPPNGGSDAARFTANSQLSGNVNTTSGGAWLSLALEGAGSFRFLFPYRIQARHQEGMAEGTYNGTIAVGGSNVAAENKSVAVRLQVTSQPIARPGQQQVAFRLAPNAPATTQVIGVANGGLGTLAVSGASATTASGGSWLAAATGANNTVSLTANPSGVAAGSYRGTVTIASNAANASVAIPVTLDVVAEGPPLAAFGGVVNSGNFDGGLAPGSVAAVFGEQFSTQAPGQPGTIPLPAEHNGVRVLVNDVAAPLYFTSYNQVNFQVPYNTPAGEAVIRVERGGQRGNPLAVAIAPRAPRIIQVGLNGVVVNADGSLAIEGGRAARRGDVITIYAVGLGATSPAVTTGAGSPAQEPLARVTPAPRVVFGNAFMGADPVDPLFVGLTPGLVGLYQINVIIPEEAGAGSVQIALEGDGYRSNSVILPVAP